MYEATEAWRGVLEFQVLKNGIWEDRIWYSGIYNKGSNGPMYKVNEKIRELESGRYFEGNWRDKNIVRFAKDEVTILSKYKEVTDSWRRV